MVLLELLALGSLALAAAQNANVPISGFPDTDVVIVSNNDLDPSNPNRASALFLTSAFSCEEAYAACAALQETLLPPPAANGTGLNAQNLSVALTSERHGAALDEEQEIWIAADGGHSVRRARSIHALTKPRPQSLRAARSSPRAMNTRRTPLLTPRRPTSARASPCSARTPRRSRARTSPRTPRARSSSRRPGRAPWSGIATSSAGGSWGSSMRSRRRGICASRRLCLCRRRGRSGLRWNTGPRAHRYAVNSSLSVSSAQDVCSPQMRTTAMTGTMPRIACKSTCSRRS